MRDGVYMGKSVPVAVVVFVYVQIHMYIFQK